MSPLRYITLVTIQPTPFCNIDCSYCYLPGRDNKARMDLGTLERIFRQIFAFGLEQSALTVSWHAGEPLTVPLDWYEKAFALIDRLTPANIKVEHAFQTNGLLLTEAWCRLIKQRNITVGVSLDGPERIHDAHRRFRGGAGSFAKAMAGVGLLSANGVPFSVITVLNALSLDAADELFEFYRSIGVTRINFNVEEIEGENTSSSLDRPDTVAKYAAFLRAFVDLMQKHGRDWRVREINHIYGRILNQSDQPPINGQSMVGRLLSFDHRGGVSTFSPELLTTTHPRYDNFILGNIMDTPLPELLAGDKAQNLAGEIAQGIAMCARDCDYYRICGGGAPANKLYENGSFASTETLHCRLHIKATADVVLQMLRDAVVTSSEPADSPAQS